MLSDGTSLHCPQQRSADYLSTLSAAKIRQSLHCPGQRSDYFYTVRDRDQTISTLSRTEIRQYLYCPEHSIDCAVRDRNKQKSLRCPGQWTPVSRVNWSRNNWKFLEPEMSFKGPQAKDNESLSKKGLNN